MKFHNLQSSIRLSCVIRMNFGDDITIEKLREFHKNTGLRTLNNIGEKSVIEFENILDKYKYLPLKSEIMEAIDASHRLADYCIQEGGNEETVTEDLHSIRKVTDFLRDL